MVQITGSSWAKQFRSAVRRDGPFGFRAYTIIYAIDAPDIGRIKFGKTRDIKKRFAGISNMSPAPLHLVGHVWMPDDAEAYIFDFLKDDRAHGEWFHRTEKVRSVAALVGAGMDIQLAQAIGLDWMIAEAVSSDDKWRDRPIL